MAITLTTIHGRAVNDIAEFIVDAPADVASLPTMTTPGGGYQAVPFGSSCLVIATGDVYILNSSNIWTLI